MATTGVKIVDTATPLMGDIQASMLDTVKRGALKAAGETAGVLRRVIRQMHPNGRGGLARSYRPSLVQVSRKGVVAGVFSDLEYAGVQNRGGTIRPKSVRHLAIPVSRSIPIGTWPRHFPKGELFPIRSKKGNLLLVRKKGKGFEPMYVLKKSVTIKGSNYLAIASRKAQPLIAKAVGQDVKLSVAEAGKKVGK